MAGLSPSKMLRIVIAMYFVFISLSAVGAEMEWHLAYGNKAPDSLAIFVSGAPEYPYMARAPYLTKEDFVSARVEVAEDGFAVILKITDVARIKFNALARNNVERVDSMKSEEVLGLAVVIDGRPVSVVKGVFQEIHDGELYWAGELTKTEANLYAAAINSAPCNEDANP